MAEIAFSRQEAETDISPAEGASAPRVTTVGDGTLDLIFSKAVENPHGQIHQCLRAPAVLPPGAATLAINENSTISSNPTTARARSFLKNVGGKNITRSRSMSSDALYPDSVFDPSGRRHTASRHLTVDSAGGPVSGAPNNNQSDPNNGTYVGAGEIRGLRRHRPELHRLPAERDGDVLVDMDPNSVAERSKPILDSGATLLGAGADNRWHVGGVSGAELIGSRFIVTYEDGRRRPGS